VSRPPASRFPKLADGTLEPLDKLRFPRVPGVGLPTRMHVVRRLDFGPEFRSKGIVTLEPPRVGGAYPMFVPQVAPEDGNELAGIRLPVVEVPLASYTGWNLRDAKIGAPDELFSMVGSYLAFPRTKADREKSGDPRPSIEERYRGADDYLARIKAAATRLAREGYVLERDLVKIVERARVQWERTAEGGAAGR